MGLRFIMGRAGSGKTRHCFDAIVSAMCAQPLGPPIYWILPKQSTFSAERELTTLSGLNGFCRARVLSFDLLGQEVLSACGGSAATEVSALGRQMLLGFLLRKHQDKLRYFRSVVRQPGLAARLDVTFAEFERCGKDADALEALLHDLSADSDDADRDLLREKVFDFHLLYRAYRDFLGQERVDPHRRLELVLQCIHDHAPLRGASVYIDGFLEFTERERKIIAALAKSCASVDVTILIDPASKTVQNIHHIPDELSLFYRTEMTYRQLALSLGEAGVKIDPPLVLTTSRRFESPALAAIESTLFTHSIKPVDAGGAVEMVEAPDRRGEVDAAARRIRELLTQGRRLRDIAVLVRDLDEYEPLIAAAFREHDIWWYFIDRRRTASHHPLIQCLRSMLAIARQNWPHDAVISLLKSGLAGLELDEAEQLENYVLLHRIKGIAWERSEPWTFSRTLRRDDRDDASPIRASDAARMDALRRRVVDPLNPLVRASIGDRPRAVRAIIVDLFNVFKTLRVRETLGRWIDEAAAANDPEQAGEHEQVWKELVELFDQMIELLGEQAVSLADFVEILEAGLEQFDLALPPARIDQVLVGQVDRTRVTRIDTAIVLGLSEGQFPKIGREDSVLSDAERRSLRKMNLDIDPDSTRRLLDENLLGYIAFTRASRMLIVLRPTSQDNKLVGGSAFWARLRRLLAKSSVTQEKKEFDANAQAIGTPRQLITALMRWARSTDPQADAEQPWPALYQWLTDYECCDDAIDVMRYRAWKALTVQKRRRALSRYCGATRRPGVLRQRLAHRGIRRLSLQAFRPLSPRLGKTRRCRGHADGSGHGLSRNSRGRRAADAVRSRRLVRCRKERHRTDDRQARGRRRKDAARRIDAQFRAQQVPVVAHREESRPSLREPAAGLISWRVSPRLRRIGVRPGG